MSIGFRVNKGRDTWNKDYTERVIHEVYLREVSIVRQGANPYTSAAVRSIDDLLTADTSEWSEDEIRRALKHLESLLPTEEREAVNEFAERDRLDRERNERYRLLRV